MLKVFWLSYVCSYPETNKQLATLHTMSFYQKYQLVRMNRLMRKHDSHKTLFIPGQNVCPVVVVNIFADDCDVFDSVVPGEVETDSSCVVG